MKRRSLGVIGTLALAGTFAVAATPAFADNNIELEETYNFTSPSSGTYTLSMVDGSGELITEAICSRAAQKGTTTAFRTDGAATICDISQELASKDIPQVLQVSDPEFTFTSQTSTALSTLGSQTSITSMKKVTAKFASGMTPTSADNNGTIDKVAGTITWENVSSNVSAEGTTKADSSAASGSASSDSKSDTSSSKSASSSSSSMKWLLLGVLALIVVGGIVAFVVASGRKKNQAQPVGAPGMYPGALPGVQPEATQYPAPTGQTPVEPAQYPQAPQAEQYPQAPQVQQYPEQGQQPGQYPQA